MEFIQIEGDLKTACIQIAAKPNEDDEAPVATARSVYKLQSVRAATYAAAYPSSGLKPDGSNGICVAGTDAYDEETEAVIVLDSNGQPNQVIQSTDAIMMETCNLCAFPEFQFEAGEQWRMCTGGAMSIGSYRGMKFAMYEKSIKACPPPCMAGLARMIHVGPVTKLYENADVGSQIFPMSKEEMLNFQHTRPDGKVVNLPRVVHALRVFKPATGTYELLPMRLDGAPENEEQEGIWFDNLVTHLKSNLHGAPAADDEMLSFYEKELLESDQFKHQVEQMGENKWILRFKEVKGSLKK
tara:strand:+ start:106 stop:999 length:894 start_codon:yes stop_codon:yes gene_type:complete